MWLGISFEVWELIAKLVALQGMILAWLAYRVGHHKEKARFRIEKVAFQDGREVFYCKRRWIWNVWQTFEIEKGIKGYGTREEAIAAMESYLNGLGFDLSETTVEKEYGGL